jgi:hypothetical protein
MSRTKGTFKVPLVPIVLLYELLEVAVQKTLQCLAVASLVAGHLDASGLLVHSQEVRISNTFLSFF